jgi:dTDP-4-amino-4,6-dideoxygalactose transaminase
MSVPFFDLTRQNKALEKEIGSAIEQVVKSGHFILGENVAALEKEVAAYCGTKFAVGVASGTDALHLALRACGIKAGDEVITSPFTFVATAEAIAYCGAAPVFVDIEPNSCNLDPDKIEARITDKTKAILPVHLYGQSCVMDKIGALAKKHRLKVIEDCAQSFGAKFMARQAGSFGDAGCLSFFPTKNIGCFGDGGMIITSDDKIAEEIRILRGHGSRKTYHYDLIGYNSRLDELQAAVLRVKLPQVKRFLEGRRNNAKTYYGKLCSLPGIILPAETMGSYHTYNQYTLRAKNRDKLFSFLKQKGIPTMVYYPLSLHLQSAFKGLGYKPGDFPEAEQAQAEVLSLPIFPELTEEEISRVWRAVNEFYQ